MNRAATGFHIRDSVHYACRCITTMSLTNTVPVLIARRCLGVLALTFCFCLKGQNQVMSLRQKLACSLARRETCCTYLARGRCWGITTKAGIKNLDHVLSIPTQWDKVYLTPSCIQNMHT